ncbi:MAG: M28 family peptidase [Ferruginibacter sp.]
MNRLKKILIIFVVLFLGLYIWGKIYSANQPALVIRQIAADTNRIKTDLYFLTKECRYRNFMHTDQLNKAAAYIKKQFEAVSDSVQYQTYVIDTVEYKNVICSIGPKGAERIIIGAHYDACMDKEGADDNASGVCGILELARLFKNEKLKYRIDLVAYANEEPPFFGTNNMGSYIHAKSLFNNDVKVKGMISLEMIGMYSDEPGSQHFPVFFLKWFYGSTGNFITVTNKLSSGSFGRFISKRMQKEQVIPTKSFTAPSWAGGIDLSDHRNYWAFDYSAVMITNTAFYRNEYYHTINDIAERLNVKKMSLVIDEVYRTILDVK